MHKGEVRRVARVVKENEGRITLKKFFSSVEGETTGKCVVERVEDAEDESDREEKGERERDDDGKCTLNKNGVNEGGGKRVKVDSEEKVEYEEAAE